MTWALREIVILAFLLHALCQAIDGAAASSELIAVATYSQGVLPTALYQGVSDTTLHEWYPLSNLRADPLLYVGRQGASGERMALLRFDLRDLPVNVEVITATLSLEKLHWTASEQPLELQRLARLWDAGIASWSFRAYPRWGDPRWGWPGCQGPADRDFAAISASAPRGTGIIRWDVTELASGWIAEPGRNHGVLISGPRATEVVRFASSEGNAAQRPRLSITYRASAHDTPPSVSIVSPDNWERVWGEAIIRADADDDQAISRVEFLVGEPPRLLGVDTEAPYEMAWDSRRAAWQSQQAPSYGPNGLAAVSRIDMLPLLRDGVQVHQVSSRDPHGANSDLRNYLYRRGGEYVVLDAVGPGCVYNIWFTSIQEFSRIRFYFDGEATPRIDMDVGQFFSGTAAPFLSPLVGEETVSSGGYYSYLPMAFERSLIVACVGEPWYYHILYQTMDDRRGISTFSGQEDASAVYALWQTAGANPLAAMETRVISGTVGIPAAEATTLASLGGSGAITSLRFGIDPHATRALEDLWLSIRWDGEESPSVDAPLGLFFGSGLGLAHVRSLLMGMDTSGTLYCYFPMPYWHSAEVELRNASDADVSAVEFAVGVSDEAYPQGQTGYFRARHHDRRVGPRDGDYVILEVRGRGHYVGTVLAISGGEPGWPRYLEGDERVYLDHSYTPTLYGTGTEDYFQGGWYFRYGPFTLPSHGSPTQMVDSEEHIACYRLHISDMIPFSSSIRFGIEHGADNVRSGHYRSVAYYYALDEPAGHFSDQVDVADPASEESHGYAAGSDATRMSATRYFEGEWDDVPMPESGLATSASRFRLAISPLNWGLRLWRLRDQSVGRQSAQVRVDGRLAGTWYTPYANPIKAWAEEPFLIPPELGLGKNAITVSLAANGPWNEYAYRMQSLDASIPLIVRAYDGAGQMAEAAVRVRADLLPTATATSTPTSTLSPTPETAIPSPTASATHRATLSMTATPTTTLTPSPTSTASLTSVPPRTPKPVFLPLIR